MVNDNLTGLGSILVARVIVTLFAILSQYLDILQTDMEHFVLKITMLGSHLLSDVLLTAASAVHKVTKLACK